MHLHLLPLSGEATSAGTVAKKKGKTVNTIKTHEPNLAGNKHIQLQKLLNQNGSNYDNDSYYEAVTRYKVLD